jgi:phytoene dehydrogenase-like protein
MGGAKALPKAFIRELRRCGGEIHVRTGVWRILIEDHGSTRRVVGVRLENGEQVQAPLVISNADPAVTYGKLVESGHLHPKIQRRLRRTKWSTSALSLFLAVDMDVRAAGLDSGNYWWSMTSDIQGNYDKAADLNLDDLKELSYTFLTCTTLKDPSRHAHGHHTLEAFSFVGWEAFRRWEDTRQGDRPGDYEECKKHLITRMLDALENTLPGIGAATVFAELGTPLTNRHYVSSTCGNLYGTEKTWSQVGPFG